MLMRTLKDPEDAALENHDKPIRTGRRNVLLARLTSAEQIRADHPRNADAPKNGDRRSVDTQKLVNF
jgi:hypothetical protein